MIDYLKAHPWKVIESEFKPSNQRISESIFSIGNGKFGQRANFEEHYSGDHHQGSYIAGIYYPDKTKVGWWKNGYPEYFAKVLNSVNWIGLDVHLDQTQLDLNTWSVGSFERILNMKTGLLSRSFVAQAPSGNHKIEVNTERFCSMHNDNIAAVKYSIKLLSEHPVKIDLNSYLDADVENEDTNWEEKFWDHLDAKALGKQGLVHSRTKKTNFEVAVAMTNHIELDGKPLDALNAKSNAGKAESQFSTALNSGQTVTIFKYVALCSDMHFEKDSLKHAARTTSDEASALGYNELFQQHKMAWSTVWQNADIIIEGDEKAQQAIRFNIFHLNQTYTGKDDRLNIGPKGFTGEKYGGSTYWDTEAYCLPFYLNTHDSSTAKQLLVYRYNHLGKAIENAEKLGFNNGAALYPMVTMNGEECHNEWEITFEEIHRNSAIAYGIYNYVKHTGDKGYLADSGFDVLLGICRFWSQRATWSDNKHAFVILGVTGPNEYENNVNNNWYTNYMAKWCLTYTLKVIIYLKANHKKEFEQKVAKYNFEEEKESFRWIEVMEKMYLPKDEERGVFLQQDGFLDKELVPASDLPLEDRPINQKWSWDRILRSVYIKQADTLQGLYFLQNHFDLETIKRNFDFYEPFTVHESSLSPCIHVVLAAMLGYQEKAYEMYLRTARLDLDDYNNEAYQGLHITSMAGTWLSVVEGFGGWRIKKDLPHLDPMLPEKWEAFSFKIMFRGRLLSIRISNEGNQVELLSGEPMDIIVSGERVQLT